ncbi:MAG: hypothetical protein DHS20C15_29290 [Planctomycetota bacterium]|nr:MAG: hypothetical protein DHS20C15_29290 [Planctomycetota bacterium]
MNPRDTPSDPHMSHDPGVPDLETLFHAALELAPAERESYLRARCAADPELLEELLSLLAAHDDAPSALDAPAWGLADRFEELFERADGDPLEAARPGSRIGHYEVRKRLGQGGMGAVYLALQRKPFRRLVALKLIKPGMDTREVVRRFASERQALARLNHPGIAAVHDAGVTEQGRPFFVMEYVPGARITDWCDARKLDLTQRLELFVRVCRAVQHAHAQGIVHRDLKPGNVLVRELDGEALPKIIDFGVAKAMIGRRGASTLSTRQGQVLGTPGYMSPEQAGAVDEAVDARSDVYSLGALLHELLTGVLPHERRRLRGASLATRLKETPPPASARVAGLGRRARRHAQRRGLSARQLMRTLHGDLDAILAHALAPQPADRYPSVAALCADLNSRLGGRSVRAPRIPRVLSLRRARLRPLVRVAALTLLGVGAAAWYWPAPASELQVAAGVASRPPRAESASLEVAQPERVRVEELCEQGVFDGLDAGQAARRQLVLNTDDVALLPGTALQLVGHGNWFGRHVIEVRAALRDDRAPIAGVLATAAQPVEHAQEQHVHALQGALEPGALGVLSGAGSLSEVWVDVPAGGLNPGDALGPALWPGHLTAHAPGQAVSGFAAEAHAAGLARLKVWVQPQLALAVPPSFTRVAYVGESSADSQSKHAAPSAASAESPALWQRAQPVPLVAQAAASPQEALVLSSLGTVGVSIGDLTGAHEAYDHTSTVPQPADENSNTPAMPQGNDTADDSLPDPESPSGPLDSAHEGELEMLGTQGGVPPADKQLPKPLKSAFTQQLWFDIEGDELLDFVWQPAGEPPQLFVQVDPGVFEERSGLGNFAEVWSTSHGRLLEANKDAIADVIGVDADGRLIYWEGVGDGSFVDATLLSGLGDIDVVRFLVADVDADGSPDLQVETPGRGVLVLRNRKGTFERLVLREPDAPFLGGTAPRPDAELQPSESAWSKSHGDL